MSREDFPQSRILTARMLSDLMRESNRNGARYCFILGAGASVESKIPSGGELEMRWMNCIMGTAEDDGTPAMNPDEMRECARRLKDDGYNEHTFDQMVEAWNKAKEKGWRTLPSELYFDLYNLRFYPDSDNGYYYLERLMENRSPSIGYRVLTLLLTEEGYRNNLVITTNFDALLEDALFLYGEKKPLSVNHEALSGFFSSNIQRPIIVRIHRGQFLRPFNTSKQTDHLEPEWEKVLDSAMENYTPIVIGYGGGDGSLMSYLEKKLSPQKKLYWCYRPGSGNDWVEDRVEKLLRERENAFLVQIAGFDALMLELGSQRFADCVTPTETVKLLQERCKGWTDNYQKQYSDLRKDPAAKKAAAPVEQAEERREAEKEELSAWDYLRRGNRAYDAGDSKTAIDAYSKAIQMEPDFAEAYSNRGIVWDELGEYQKAIDDYSEAIRLNPDYAKAYSNRGVAWDNLGEYQKAMDDYSEAIRLNPDYAKAYSNRGVVWGKQGEHQKAIDDYTEAIRINPKYKLAYENRADAYRAIGRDDLAEQDEAAAASLPDEP